MKVKELIERLRQLDPEHEVTVSGDELGIGSDICVVNTHQYDNTNYVRLITGNSIEDEEE